MLFGVALQISLSLIGLSVNSVGPSLCDFSSANLNASESLLDQIVEMQNKSSSNELAFSSCASSSNVCFYDPDAPQTELTEDKDQAFLEYKDGFLIFFQPETKNLRNSESNQSPSQDFDFGFFISQNG